MTAVQEEAEPSSETATHSNSGSSETATTTTSTLKDGFSPPPAVHQTESPDIVDAGYGLGEKRLVNVTAAGMMKAGSPSRNKKESSSPSSQCPEHMC